MRKMITKFVVSSLVLLSTACQSQQPKPQIVPAIEVKRSPSHVLGTIGESEPVYFLPIESPFYARIDTGAETSSIDATSIKAFERDGERWVAFTLKNRESGEKHRFEKPVARKSNIKRIGDDEKRYVVEMEIRMGETTFVEQFSLANRDKFEFQALIGRNILNGRAVVDPALSNTLH